MASSPRFHPLLALLVAGSALLSAPAVAPAVAQDTRTVADVRERVLSIANDDAALQGLFKGLVSARDHATLLAAANALIDENQESAIGWQYRAFASQRLGRTGPAWEAYVRCLEIDRENAWAWTQLGYLQMGAGRFDDALESLGEALRINPVSPDALRKLVLLHRDRESPVDAIEVAERALAAGAPPVWAHTELAELYWVVQDWDESLRHWELAEKAGVDEATVARGRVLVAFDRELDAEAGEARPALIDRRRSGRHWRITIGDVTVVTRIGPRLPESLGALILQAQSRYGSVLGLDRPPEGTIELYLARTDAEHEAARRARYPSATRGRAFTVRPSPMRGRPRRGGPPVAQALRLFVSYSTVEVERSLTHELGHALAHVKRPALTSWLDEAIATYLEREDAGPLGSGTNKPTLRALVRAANEGRRLRTWTALLPAGPSDFSGRSARDLYAQSWSMLHFLLHTAKVPGDLSPSRRLQVLLDETDGGPRTFEAALKLVYGRGLRDLEREWLRTLR